MNKFIMNLMRTTERLPTCPVELIYDACSLFDSS